MKQKLMVILTIIMLAFTASAYVPPELRTGTHMSEYEVVKLSLAAYDAGGRDRWVLDTLEDAAIHNTNGGRISQLREWIQKIEYQERGIFLTGFIQPGNDAVDNSIGKGLCKGYDEYCKKKVT